MTQVRAFVESGRRLDQPELCPPQLWVFSLKLSFIGFYDRHNDIYMEYYNSNSIFKSSTASFINASYYLKTISEIKAKNVTPRTI